MLAPSPAQRFFATATRPLTFTRSPSAGTAVPSSPSFSSNASPAGTVYVSPTSTPDLRAWLFADVTVSVTLASLASVVAESSTVTLTSVPPTWKPTLCALAQFLAFPCPPFFDLPWPPLAPRAVAGTANSAATSARARMFFPIFIFLLTSNPWEIDRPKRRKVEYKRYWCGHEARTRRRADRRSRPLGRRYRVPPPGALPRQELRDPRGARRHRRHLGPVPLPGHPLGLGHVHARLQLPPLARRQGDRRRPRDPQLRPRDRRRPRRRRELPAALRGHRALPRRDRPPAALARGPGLRRPARRGDRQRSDRRDARAGHGRARRARDDAPALPQLRGHAPRDRPDRRGAHAQAPGEGGLFDRPLEERAAHDAQLQPEPPLPARDAQGDPPRSSAAPPRGLRRGHPFQPSLQPVAAADVPRPRQRPLRGAEPRRRLHRHGRHRDLHRDRPEAHLRGGARGRRDRHRHGPQPAAARRH